MYNRRVVVTGFGAITPLGNDALTFWSNIKSGVCGIRPVTSFDTSEQKAKLAAECDADILDFLSPQEAKRTERYIWFALAAGREALKMSGITRENADFTRCGTLVSSGIGGLTTITREYDRGNERGFDRVWPYFIPQSIANMAAGQLAIETGFAGYCSSVVTACAGGTNAIGDSMRTIRHGYADVMLCGGTEACIAPLTLGGFTSMKALYEGGDPSRASIPFDAERSGFVLGEGAGILVLEEYEHALRRGAEILCEVTGYGATCDAYHITAPEPTAAAPTRAIADAVADAGLSPGAISYINAHGTSTPMNDKTETAAIKAAFGDSAYKIPVSSTKSMTGHLLAAAGAIEAIVCIGALRDGFVPPTINYKTPDPECDLDIVPNAGRPASLTHAMSVSLGFGGHNAAVIFSRTGGRI
ncbi:MAG: beta-ketoacyl-ACP synthase II [Oscillospiraceae bacterium]|jgi:3-oxoacyl-[acyl-carrier-protein] synthase II|nr:beta-ketoacyl-ACP synthase II [Oscillospiraceae bacterium]